MAQKKNILRAIPKGKLLAIVNKSKTIKDVLDFLGVKVVGYHYKLFKRVVKGHGISIEHFDSNHKISLVGKKIKIPLESVLVENSRYGRKNLKKRLLNLGLLKNECSICGLKSEWQGKKLIMILDHINGVSDDNRLENLRMVCPNCNSQLKTFAGRNKPRVVYYCKNCGKKITKYGKSGLCISCSQRNKNGNLNRPPKEILEKEIQENTWVALGKKYGISDNAVKKWAKGYGIEFERRRK